MSKKTIQKLQIVVNKLTGKINEYNAAGQIGYATAYKLTRRLLYFEIDKLKNCRSKAIKRRMRINKKHAVKHVK